MSRNNPRGIRNIEVPEREFDRNGRDSSKSPGRSSTSPNGIGQRPMPCNRPSTAPSPHSGRKSTRRKMARYTRPRSPSHPNYKEEAYNLSTVVLRYVGHPDRFVQSESRARHRAHRRRSRLPPLPLHLDEVTIEQQPRGSYVLEVFHGYLAVGGMFSNSLSLEIINQLNTFKNVSANLRVTQATIKRGIISPETIGEGSAFLHNWLTAVKRLDKTNLGT